MAWHSFHCRLPAHVLSSHRVEMQGCQVAVLTCLFVYTSYGLFSANKHGNPKSKYPAASCCCFLRASTPRSAHAPACWRCRAQPTQRQNGRVVNDLPSTPAARPSLRRSAATRLPTVSTGRTPATGLRLPPRTSRLSGEEKRAGDGRQSELVLSRSSWICWNGFRFSVSAQGGDRIDE